MVKGKNYVNLTVNPCKMCMPLGAVTAFYGIEGCMSIIHGSQGCSTYIRRHMATHYNEPVDIASSSLTEQGTVYGGEANLIAGVKNLIRLYNPKVIGIATTCLAETIGEDVPRIVAKLGEEEECRGVTLVPVASPGYGGTQFEGWLAAVKAVVSTLPLEREKNRAVNLLTPPMSPAEHRELKRTAEAFGLEIILLPDISDNLDRIYDPEYKRLPQDGTKIADILRMGGARRTIELGFFIPERLSAGRYLEETYGVPLTRLPLPIGLRGTDGLLRLFSELSGRPVPEEFRKERGRYLDAMVDAHKYAAGGRAVVFGEPELAYGIARLCLECGVFPAVVATGGKCPGLAPSLKDEVARLASVRLEEFHEIADECDFDKIGELALRARANLMIGNSDGRRIEEKTGVELLRAGFPIHDRVGGQRQMNIGYSGSLALMDGMANALLAHTERTFREENFRSFYRPEQNGGEPDAEPVPAKAEEVPNKTETHPCFSCEACGNARIHLPVAPACNLSCNYCSRKYDCVNESRPGVTSEVLTPEQAAEKFRLVREKLKNLTVVGIAGPGDALANFDRTAKTLSLIRQADPGVTFCISTNGLLLPKYANALVKLGVSHVTVTVNAADDATGAKIYGYADYEGERLRGEKAAALLRQNQLEGIRLLAQAGVKVKVNIVMLRGINDTQIDRIVGMVRECGAVMTNLMQLIPVAGSPFEKLGLVSNKELTAMRRQCESILPQMYHCKQCRADAVGTLDHDISHEFRETARPQTGTQEEQADRKSKGIRLAVASKNGVVIDQHFGHAREFLIYDYVGGEVHYIGKRPVGQYCFGVGDCGDDKPVALEEILRVLDDCEGVLCMRMGTEPAAGLRRSGKEVFMLYGPVESGVRDAAKLLLELRSKSVKTSGER